MRAISPDSTITVTCPWDTDTPPTEFDIAVGITGEDRIRLLDMQAVINKELEDNGRVKPSTLAAFFRECVRIGLRGMRHMTGGDGKTVEMEFVNESGNRRVVSDKIIAVLQASSKPGTGYDTLMNWVGAEIWQRLTMTPEQKKTFDARLKSVISGEETPASSGTTTTPTMVTEPDSTTPIN